VTGNISERSEEDAMTVNAPELDGGSSAHHKKIAQRAGQAGAELVFQLMGFGPLATITSCAIDIWKARTSANRDAYLEALCTTCPDLPQRLQSLRNGDDSTFSLEQLELIHDGLASLKPSASSERIAQIVRLVSSGLGESQVQARRAARMTSLFASLSDDEVLVLMHFDATRSGPERQVLSRTHPEFWPLPLPTRNVSELFIDEALPAPSEAETRELAIRTKQHAEALLHFRLCARKLCSIGLLTQTHPQGSVSPTSVQITKDGQELLRIVGLLCGTLAEKTLP
jgi:hypothetical protein